MAADFLKNCFQYFIIFVRADSFGILSPDKLKTLDMKKDEIISRINFLTRAVKTRGRAYSAAKREEMKKEITTLNDELGKINLEEDIEYINDFEVKYPSHLIPERETLKITVDYITNNTTDIKLKSILEFKTKPFCNEINYLENYHKEIPALRDALDHLNKNEEIPISNTNRFKNKEEIQKSLASNFRIVTAKINKLNISLNEIQVINNFYLNDSKLNGFVYLSEAIFTDASDFDKGFSIVAQGSKKMYFTYTGDVYKIETDEKDLPTIKTNRANADLVPFEIKDGDYNKLMGYKNSNGEIVVPAQYKTASPFINGFAKVGILKKDWTKYAYGLIDSNGKHVLPCEFVELGDVYNDVACYKRYISKDGYVRTSSFNFNMRLENKSLRLSGFLVFGEIKPAIVSEIIKLNEIENAIPNLKRHEVDNANDRIANHRIVIEFYLTFIVNNGN